MAETAMLLHRFRYNCGRASSVVHPPFRPPGRRFDGCASALGAELVRHLRHRHREAAARGDRGIVWCDDLTRMPRWADGLVPNLLFVAGTNSALA